MTSPLPWFRFYTDFLDDKAVAKLTVSHQLLYVKILCLAGRESLDLTDIPGLTWQLRLGDETHTCALISALETEGLVKCGKLTQWRRHRKCSDTSTDRVRKHRRNVSETLQKRSSNALDRDIEESRVDKNPPNPPAGGAALDAKTDAVNEVVAHLNAVTGRTVSASRAVDQITARLKEGYSVDDCRRVVDYLWSLWGGDAKMRQYVDKTTPFRKANFARYLDACESGPIDEPRADFGRLPEMPEV